MDPCPTERTLKKPIKPGLRTTMNKSYAGKRRVRVLGSGRVEVVGYDGMQTVFLKRLARLVHLERSVRHLKDEELSSMMQRAIYSTLRDCEVFGVPDEARRLLKKQR